MSLERLRMLERDAAAAAARGVGPLVRVADAVVADIVRQGPLIAKIVSDVPGRTGATWGSAVADLGRLNASNEWAVVLAGQTIFNRSLSKVDAPSSGSHPDLFEIVDQIDGKWVLTSNVQLQALDSYSPGTESHIAQCGGSGAVPKWYPDAPVTNVRVDTVNFKIDIYTACDNWITIHTGAECEEPA